MRLILSVHLPKTTLVGLGKWLGREDYSGLPALHPSGRTACVLICSGQISRTSYRFSFLPLSSLYALYISVYIVGREDYSPPFAACVLLFRQISRTSYRFSFLPLSSLYAHLHQRLYLAGPGGFEPPNARIKTWCLTAWRRPNINSFRVPYLSRLATVHEVLSIVSSCIRTGATGFCPGK